MKKILAVMLSIMMLVSTITLVAEASEILTPVSMYAGARTVTVEYGLESLTSENIGEISLTTLEGAPVEFTTKINGKFLSVIADEEFVRDTQSYFIEIGGVKKLFTVKTLFKPNFVADAVNKKVSGLSYGRGNGVVVDVVDENTVILGANEGGFVIDYDDIKNYENASIVADVYFTGDSTARANGVFVYNMSSKTPTYAFTYNGAGSVHRAFWFLHEQNSKFYNRRVAITDGTALKEFVGYSTNELPVNTTLTDNDMKISISSNNYGSAFTSNAATVGTTTLPENFEANASKHRYVIDKMGTIGTLLMNDTFIDIMDSQDYYDAYNTANSTTLTSDKTGYFAISPIASNFRMIVSNVALITSTMRELATGKVFLDSVSTSGTEITIKFRTEGDELDLSQIADIKDYILLSEGDYDVVSVSNDTAVLKVKNVSYEPATITVKKGLGYDNLKVENDIVENYSFVARVGELNVESVKGGDSKISIEFNMDVTDIKAQVIKDKIKFSLNEAVLAYTPVINGKTISLDFGDSLERDVVYDLQIDAGFGYEKVLLKDTFNKYFIFETVVNETFDSGKIDDYFTMSRNGESKIAESMPYATIRNGKLYIEENDWATIYFNKFGLEKYNDYIMKFDMEHYKTSPRDHFYINVPKNASGIAHYGANLKGVGWRQVNGDWNEFMQWGPSRTGQKGMYSVAAQPGGSSPEYTTQSFDITENDGEVIFEGTAPASTNYIIEKNSDYAKLFVNKTLVDSLNASDIFKSWNQKHTDATITDEAPQSGIFVYSSARSSGENGKVVSGVAFEGFEISVFKEYSDGEIKIVERNETIDGTNASGTVKLRNYGTESEKITVLAMAYGENNTLLGAKKIVDTQLGAGQFVTGTYNFSSDIEVVRTKVEIINKDIDVAEIKVDTVLQTDIINNTISVKGSIDKADTDREVYFMLVKDSAFTKEWTVLDKKDANIIKVDISANQDEFEYSFKFKDDATEYAKMTLYKLEWNEEGVDYKAVDTYHYARNDAVNLYVDKVKTTQTTPEEFEKYAQSMGIDLKFADNGNKQNVVTETIFAEKATISGIADIVSIVEIAKARILMLAELKNATVSAGNVNTVIKKYETNARMNLTEYNLLTEAQKVKVCNKFIGADYEISGFEAFVQAFSDAVKAAKTNSPAGGGGGGGGASGGSTAGTVGGLPMNVTDTPAKDAVEIIGTKQGFVDMSEHAWAEKAVNALADKGVITGVGDKKFNPDGTVTREQIAKMIVSALNELDNEATVEYKDVDASGWAYKFIASAKKSGLMKGFSETEFAPLSAVTREDLCVILYRATLKKNQEYKIRKTDFTDKAEIADYAKDAVEFMSGAGIINGFEDGSFNPKAPATRAQAAVLIYNALIGGNK